MSAAADILSHIPRMAFVAAVMYGPWLPVVSCKKTMSLKKQFSFKKTHGIAWLAYRGLFRLGFEAALPWEP
jgi:hypothetical protein